MKRSNIQYLIAFAFLLVEVHCQNRRNQNVQSGNYQQNPDRIDFYGQYSNQKESSPVQGYQNQYGQRQQQQQQPQYQSQYESVNGPQIPQRLPESETGRRPDLNLPFGDALISFSLDMFKTVANRNRNQNIVVSPLSVATILSYIQQLSEGLTEQEITKALLQYKESSIADYSSLIKSLLEASNSKNTLQIANAMFLSNKFRVNGTAKNIAREWYKAHVDALNFGNPQEAANAINFWTRKHTNNVIEELISPSKIERSSECILLNAVYFKGVWQKRFDASRTKLLDYSPDSGTSIKKQFMLHNERFDVGDDDSIGARWVSIPYDGNRYAMVFVIPQQKHNLDNVINSLTAADFDKIINTGEDYKCALAIPKFNVSYELGLADVLQELGIKQIFTANSQITKLSQADRGMTVSSANQKSSISIDEVGTVAASVTSLGVNTLSLPSPSELFVFKLMEPFLAILVDKKKRVPIMITKIYDP